MWKEDFDLCWLMFSERCVGCVVVSQDCTATLVQRMVFLEEPGCSRCFRARGWLVPSSMCPGVSETQVVLGTLVSQCGGALAR